MKEKIVKNLKIKTKIKYLLFNIGSRTIKYSFFEGDKLQKKEIIYTKDFLVIKKLLNEFSPNYILHRVVHGGDIKKECFIDKKIINKIKEFSKFAPLHNPRQAEAIEFCEKIKNQEKLSFKQIAIFDTSFFSNIPDKARIYPIPIELTKKYEIYRYGFHGLSHENNALNFLNKNIISCHLGSGCSISPIAKGRALDISMGLTPMEGVMMATRSGSIDPGIILFLAEEFGIEETKKILNNCSGFFGLTKKEDVKEVYDKRYEKENKLALEIFCYNVAKQICSYFASMSKVDYIVFSGGIGEKNSWIVNKICSQIPFKFNKKIVQTDEEKIMLNKAIKLIN